MLCILLLTNTLLCAHINSLSVSRPDPPTGLAVSDIQPHSIRVSWDDQPDADSYIVQYNSLNFVGGIQLGVCSNETHSGSINTAGSTTSIIVGEGRNRLRAFTTYSFTVVAVNDTLGRSRPTNPSRVITTARTGYSCMDTMYT